VAPSQPEDRHLTPEDLTRSATGEPVHAQHTAHLAYCPACQAEVSAYRRVVTALAEPVDLAEVPAGLWDRIDAALAGEGAAPQASGAAGGRAIDGDAVRDAEPPGPFEPSAPSAPSALSERRARRKQPDRERRASWRWVAAAAVAGLLFGAGAAAVFGPLLDRTGPETPAPVAVGSAELVAFTPDGIQGQAEMTRSPDGHLELTVQLSGIPADGFREVWLRNEDATRLLSLGVMSTPSASLAVPDGVDLSEFPVVDVSQEEFDGNPAHSGVTLAAGAMTAE
jgi:hypothetical protein